MSAVRKIKRVKYLMLFSQLLLLAFMGYWLYTEYRDEKNNVRKEVMLQFHESQRMIADSLLLDKLSGEGVLPGTAKIATVNIHPQERVNVDVGIQSNHNFDVIRTQDIKRPEGLMPGETYIVKSTAESGPDKSLLSRKDVNVSVRSE